MYDWPEIRSHTETYLSLLVESFAERGFENINVPSSSIDPWNVWRNPQLLLGQTCGLPLVARLGKSVGLVGTPAYSIEGDRGSYHSVFIVPEAINVETLEEFNGRRYAYNHLLSQSGFAAFHSTFGAIGRCSEDWDHAICTGSHRESICAVAARHADIAAIDSVSFGIAKAHLPEARAVRVIGRSIQTPGLPYITGSTFASRREDIAGCADDAILALPQASRDALLLEGFIRTEFDDYGIIAECWESVQDGLSVEMCAAIDALAK